MEWSPRDEGGCTFAPEATAVVPYDMEIRTTINPRVEGILTPFRDRVPSKVNDGCSGKASGNQQFLIYCIIWKIGTL